MKKRGNRVCSRASPASSLTNLSAANSSLNSIHLFVFKGVYNSQQLTNSDRDLASSDIGSASGSGLEIATIESKSFAIAIPAVIVRGIEL